jgi:hypothetical protein
MTYWDEAPRHFPARPKAAQVAGALLALTASPDAQARVETMIADWGGEPAKPPGRSRESRQRQQQRAQHAEATARKVLRQAGYTVVQTHAHARRSQAADLIASKPDPWLPGPAMRHVQVKSVVSWRTDTVVDGYCRFMGWGRWRTDGPYRVIGSREIWVWEYGRGWVAEITVHPDGSIGVAGPRAQEVTTAIERRRARERAAHTAHDEQRATFNERLER